MRCVMQKTNDMLVIDDCLLWEVNGGVAGSLFGSALQRLNIHSCHLAEL